MEEHDAGGGARRLTTPLLPRPLLSSPLHRRNAPSGILLPALLLPATGVLPLLLLGLFAVASGGPGPRQGAFNRAEAGGAEACSILTFHDCTSGLREPAEEGQLAPQRSILLGSPYQLASQTKGVCKGGRRRSGSSSARTLSWAPATRATAAAGRVGGDLRRGPPRRGRPRHPVSGPEVGEAGRRGVHQRQRQPRDPRRRRCHLREAREEVNW